MPVPLWLVKLGVVALAVTGVWFHGRHTGIEREQAKTAAQIQAAEANARAVTARRFQTLQEASDAEFLARKTAQRDAAAARAAVVGLRQQADQFARGLPGDPAAASSCAPADDRASVLADLLGRAAERADQLAEQADSARIAGQLCVSAYDSLTAR